MPIYVLDTNFFIQAHRAYYPLDVVPSFWDKLKQLADDGKVISIDKVREEIYHGNDELTDWCKTNLPENFFRSTIEPGSIEKYRQVVQWTTSKAEHYNQEAIDEFMEAKNADAFLISFAMEDASNRVLVTYEVSQPNRKNRIKIPEPCQELQVRFIKPLDMLRELGESF